jgi:hypothetical protein
MKSSLHFYLLAPFFLASQALAAPKIQFDTKIVQCGTIIEGKPGVVTAVFNVKNIGDAVLRLESVRPSCVCVFVRYDTVVQPGKSAKIEATVDFRGSRNGPFLKGITVSSNAQNEPTARLTIRALFRAAIDIQRRYVSFNVARNNTDTLYAATTKTDLKILGIEFHASDNSADKPDWQANLPLAITVKPLSMDSTRADGYTVFVYELIAPAFKESQGGQINIKTNHPDKPEIALHATLLR